MLEILPIIFALIIVFLLHLNSFWEWIHLLYSIEFSVYRWLSYRWKWARIQLNENVNDQSICTDFSQQHTICLVNYTSIAVCTDFRIKTKCILQHGSMLMYLFFVYMCVVCRLLYKWKHVVHRFIGKNREKKCYKCYIVASYYTNVILWKF